MFRTKTLVQKTWNINTKTIIAHAWVASSTRNSRASFTSSPFPSITTFLVPPLLRRGIHFRASILSRPFLPYQSRSQKRSVATTHKNYYDILNVPKTATEKELKKAYYQLAKQYHPDSSTEPNAKERFMEIQEAYDNLSDPQKRAHYDQFGTSDFSQQAPHHHEHTGGFSGSSFFNDFMGTQDLFKHLFFRQHGAGRTGGHHPHHSMDIELECILPFEKAIQGCLHTVHYQKSVICKGCEGVGYLNYKKTPCGTCRGSGEHRYHQNGFTLATECPVCQGSGAQPPPASSACRQCQGEGHVESSCKTEVSVPPGVDSGMKLRVDGKGNEHGGRVGDLYIVFKILPSKVFRRKGNDLFTTLSIPLSTALTGGIVHVPKLGGGETPITLTPGTQPNEEKVLKRMGVQDVHKPYVKGDYILSIQVRIPRCPDSKKKDVLTLLKEIEK